jgi:sec-independent protein translocase protein TatC
MGRRPRTNSNQFWELASQLKSSWIEHLEELRKRILYVGIAFLVVFLACLTFITRLYHYFVSPLANLHLQLVVVSPGEIVTVYLAIAGVLAIGLALPFVMWETWKFVSPGLTKKERTYTLRLIPFTCLMFVAGLCFAWFLVFPTILHFLIRFTMQQGLGMFLRAGSYFSFLTSIVLPFGFVFELPVIVVFLTRIGVVTPKFLRKSRRFAYLIIVIFGVLISPPELISHLSVTVPMVCLYELSILLSVFALANRLKHQEVFE